MSAREEPYTPIIIAVLWRAQLGRRYELTSLGLERRCARCREWWPADTEFFPACQKSHGDGLHSYCRACWQDAMHKRKAPPLPSPSPIGACQT